MYPENNEQDSKKRIDLRTEDTYLAVLVGGVPGDAIDLKKVIEAGETNTRLKVDVEGRKLVYENEAFTRGDVGATPDTISMDNLGEALLLDDLADVQSLAPAIGDFLVYTGEGWSPVTPEVGDAVSFLALDINGLPIKTTSTGGSSGGGAAIPIGGGYFFAGPEANIPAGFIPQDGRELSRSVYSILFGLIGTAYGAGDGSTTFNIPNTKGRTIIGPNTADSTINVPGKVVGIRNNLLTKGQLPAGITGQIVWHGQENGSPVFDSYGVFSNSPVINGRYQRGTTINGAYSRGPTNFDLGGSGEAVDNMQPSLVENIIMRVI